MYRLFDTSIHMNKTKEVIGFKRQKRKIACLACTIQSGKVKNPGQIASTKYFDAQQDYEIPIPGFVILVSKRHLQSIDEFSQEEQEDFIKFLCRLRYGIRKALGIKHVYLIQEEDTTTSHFHVWIFPRYQWMTNKFGRKIHSVVPIMEYARENLKTKNDLKQVKIAIEKLRKFFYTK